MDDQDEGSGGRIGRVRKKSAKVLEMEEFEQAEKGSHGVKKGKGVKLPSSNQTSTTDDIETTPKTSGKKVKTLKTVDPTNDAVKSFSKFLDSSRAVPAELTLRVPKSQGSPSPTTSPQPGTQPAVADLKPGSPPASSTQQPLAASVKKEDPKSVIKYLLSSPSAGSSQAISKVEPALPPAPTTSSSSLTPKIAKRKNEEKAPKSSKSKEKKPKIEILSPSELPPAPTASQLAGKSSSAGVPTLKMKITGGLNPSSTQAVPIGSSETIEVPKVKKTAKKIKIKQESGSSGKTGILGLADHEGSPPPAKKSKVSKKKEKLIQDAISAVHQMPNLAALVASAGLPPQGLSDLSPPAGQKVPKKKMKMKTVVPVKTESPVMDDTIDSSFDAEGDESTLVIAEKEKKKKKVLGKKKGAKDKEGASPSKEDKLKKIPKRAPTAYMLFCNTHRATIVSENPGIEFAGISRKLGELWQTQSSKQKLQWRRKAQRRKKKSNLISTGKTGKDSQGGSAPAASSSAATVSPPFARMNMTQKLAGLLQKPKGQVADDAPLSPTKVGIQQPVLQSYDSEEGDNFSIEPMDVAAHLKLLGESLSIIGMRLQEHKGMIAVQGSLSVLLDSLICACGPLLCLTQQVPGMDGCTPSLHAQTLDSVAYVMPGL